MPDPGTHRLILVTDSLPAAARVWGNGGWQAPEDREALDWLTLARLLGWQVTVARPGRLSRLPRADWIVVACARERPSTADVQHIEGWLTARPGLLVARATQTGDPLDRLVGSASGATKSRARLLAWPRADGSAGRSQLGASLALADLAPGARAWARLGDRPLVTLRPVGRGRVATLAAHPSALRDAGGGGTALIVDLLVTQAGTATSWRDWQGSVILRMDDPGAAQNVYLESWTYPKLHAPAWSRIGRVLADEDARLSIAYVPGWVDDGESGRGTLRVAGRAAPRQGGRIWPASKVVYVDRHGHAPGTRHDGTSEFRGIQALRRRGLADVELHGHTHMYPDARAWSRAPDRYTRVEWFRELGPFALPHLRALPPEQHPLARGIASLARQFHVRPVALVAPGDAFTVEAQRRALDLGIAVFSSYYTALRCRDRLAWCTHLCAPYLDQAAPQHFASPLPVVGYFHDRDVAVHGVAWLRENLAAWRAAGATRFIDFRVLAACLGETNGGDEDADLRALVPLRHHAPGTAPQA